MNSGYLKGTVSRSQLSRTTEQESGTSEWDEWKWKWKTER